MMLRAFVRDYHKIYNTLPEEVKDAMYELFLSGVSNSGVWVRFKDVAAVVAFIVEAIRAERKEEQA